MAASISTIGAVNRAPVRLNAPSAPPATAFLGSSLKKLNSRLPSVQKASMKIVAEADEDKNKDKWSGLAYDISDDQQDITRGKGMVDSLFQAPQDAGTHYAVLSSYEYLSTGLRKYDMDNTLDGLYIAPAFMDKLVVHISKNFMNLPNIKVPSSNTLVITLIIIIYLIIQL